MGKVGKTGTIVREKGFSSSPPVAKKKLSHIANERDE